MEIPCQVTFTCSRKATINWLKDLLTKGYQMVFASLCEHASSVFLFASTSSDQFSHASSKHFINFPQALSNWMGPFDTRPKKVLSSCKPSADKNGSFGSHQTHKSNDQMQCVSRWYSQFMKF